MDQPHVIKLCGHCGNKVPFVVKSLYSYGGIKWRILQCLACSKPTFDQVVVLFDNNTGNTYDSEPVKLYPLDKTPLTNLPEEIQKEYEATLKVRNISSNACAVLARRTLEAIFAHENAVGNTLMQKVDYLFKSASIPPLLADIAHLGRQIGNLGAHFDKGDATEEDVSAMLDFLETILEYLYVLPAKVATVKARLTTNS